MSKDEENLEKARDRIHGSRVTDKDRREFKNLSKKVAEARQEARRQREAAGPPVPENNGDAVVRAGTR